MQKIHGGFGMTTINKEKEIYAIWGLLDRMHLWAELNKYLMEHKLYYHGKLAICSHMVLTENMTFETFKDFLITSNFIQ